MPNWCNNTISITGPKAKVQKIKQAILKDQFLQYLYPMPKILEGTTSPAPQDMDKVQRSTMMAQTGYDNWYDWRVNNWATKWEVSRDYAEPNMEDHGDGEANLTWSFDSAWSPPTGAYEEFLAKNEDVSIYATYYEPGCDFMGIWDSGDDRSYVPGDYKSDDDFWNTADGMELDENYGIVESKAEWEAEQEDEGLEEFEQKYGETAPN